MQATWAFIEEGRPVLLLADGRLLIPNLQGGPDFLLASGAVSYISTTQTVTVPPGVIASATVLANVVDYVGAC